MNQIWAWMGSIVLTIGTVWTIVNKWSPKIRKGIKITNETLDVLEALLNAVEDRKITKSEIELLMKEIQELQAVLK